MGEFVLPKEIEKLPLEKVVAYGFQLDSDLERMFCAANAGLPEATALYGARILEGTVDKVVEKFGIKLAGNRNTFSCLGALRNGRLIDSDSFIAADQLRRLGNDARHFPRRFSGADASLAVSLVRRWLGWCLTQSAYSDVSYFTPVWHQSWSDMDDPVTTLLDITSASDAQTVIAELAGVLEYNSSFACLAMERLVDLECFELAAEQIPAGKVDPRFIELGGLTLSRLGKVEQAIEMLKPLINSGSPSFEARGILAGALKRRWVASQDKRDLEESLKQYGVVWEASGSSEIYCGINVAATSAWLGKAEKSRRAAKQVVMSLNVYKNIRRERNIFNDQGFYDRVSRAEAHLLLGDVPTAERLYQSAFSMKATPGQRKAAQEQLTHHRKYLSVSLLEQC